LCVAGALCTLFATQNRKSASFYEAMDGLNTYLRTNQVASDNRDLCVTLRLYYRFLHSQKDNASQILDAIGPSLQGRLAYQVRPLIVG